MLKRLGRAAGIGSETFQVDVEGPSAGNARAIFSIRGGRCRQMNVRPNCDREDEMRSSYLDYAMSVIVGRALPDA